MTLNTILQTCGKCETKYRELYAKYPRLTDEEILDEMNKYNETHQCPLDPDTTYDIYLKSGQIIYNAQLDGCNEDNTNQTIELTFAIIDAPAKTYFRAKCNARDIVAINEDFNDCRKQQSESIQTQTHGETNE